MSSSSLGGRFLVVFSDELKQSFLTRKAIIALACFAGVFFTAIFWIKRLEMMMESRFTKSEIKVGEVFMRIFSDRFYESFPLFEGAPIFAMILYFFCLLFLPMLVIVLCYDVISGEMSDKVFRYFAFRVNLATLCLGKYFALVVQFAIITGMLWIIAIVYSLIVSTNFEIVKCIQYAFHFWFVTQFLIFFLTAFALFMSSIFLKTLRAMLLLSVVLTYLFIRIDVLNTFGYEIFVGLLQPLNSELSLSLAFFTGMSILLVTLATLHMKRRDI